MIESSEKLYQITITNRKTLTLNGVLSVDSFGEDYLVLCTSLGELTVEGENLKIESLSKENGEIFIVGKINAFFYKEEKTEKGFLKKIFK